MLNAMVRSGFVPTLCVLQKRPGYNKDGLECQNSSICLTKLKIFIHGIVSLRFLSAFFERRHGTTDVELLELLKRHGIPMLTVSDHNGPATATALSQLEPDIIVLGGAGIIKRHIFSKPKIGTLNVHPGLLPEYRGQSVVPWAIWNGDELGATAHFVDGGLDTGPIVVKRKYEGTYSNTWDAKYKIERFAADVLVDALKVISAESGFSPIKQQMRFKKYMPMTHKQLLYLNLRLALRRIFSSQRRVASQK